MAHFIINGKNSQDLKGLMFSYVGKNLFFGLCGIMPGRVLCQILHCVQLYFYDLASLP